MSLAVSVRLRSSIAAAALLACPFLSFAQIPAHVASHAQSLGQESASTPLSGSVWLKLHNKAELDARVKALYTKGSPTFHKWLSSKDLAAYAPTTAEVAAVKAELAAHHLTVTSADTGKAYVNFSGTASDVEAAFHTQVGRYQVRNEKVRFFTAAPTLAGGAAGLVSGVTGITGGAARSYARRPVDPATGKPMVGRPMSAAKAADATAATSSCLQPSDTYTFAGATAQGSASASYTGMLLSYGCAYSASDLANIYGLNKPYQYGITGGGQTIVIVDAYGSPTLQQDLDYYSSVNGLPSTTVNIVYPNGKPSQADAGWAEETTLDVESAHAIAPGAKITLLVAPTNSNDFLSQAVSYAVTNHLGNVVSNSYGLPEYLSDAATAQAYDQINEQAAAAGISVQYSTGDDGDTLQSDGEIGVSMPSDSPYATAVGGTSVVVSPFDGSVVTTGWGTNLTVLENYYVADPPGNLGIPGYNTEGFQSGSGGGTSIYFAKPSYQSSLSGNYRQLPDVSALADPYTPFNMIQTVDGQFTNEPIGGTSLASPVFSAIWALLCQYEGGAGLGQAAPYVAQAAGTVTLPDVLPPPSGIEVSGSITDATGTTQYSDASLSQPLQASSPYATVLWGDPTQQFLFSLTFATDSSLAVTQGWDPVTGYGTPDFHWVQ